MQKQKTIYLDHAATTPVDEKVLKVMQPFFSAHFGNPSALYSASVKANEALNDARRSIAEVLNTQPDTIIFTSGGTESDNLAIFGIANSPLEGGVGGVMNEALKPHTHLPPSREESATTKKHIISIGIEHPAVLEPLERLKNQGWVITYIPVDKTGLVNASEVIKAIRPETILISIMFANNEIGTIEPIAEIGRQLLRYRKEHNTSLPYFHTDACQAAGYLDLSVEKLHVDLMTVNSGKIYGPKGVGCLYVRRGLSLEPQQLGGSQEKHLRAGTENIPGIVGFAKALELVHQSKQKETLRLEKLTAYFWQQIQKKFSHVTLNGPIVGDKRLPNNLNITFPGVDGEALLIYLDSFGISCSTGSACTATTAEPSHVLKTIGLTEAQIKSTIRFSLGKTTSKQDIDYTIRALTNLLPKLRS